MRLAVSTTTLLCLFMRWQLAAAAVVARQNAAGASANNNVPIPNDVDVPIYVLQYAPYVYLYSQETYWPANLQTHLDNCTPKQNQSGNIVTVRGAPSSLTLANLNQSTINTVNDYFTSNTYITVPEVNASWLLADYGKPDSSGKSESPVIIVLVNKTDVSNQSPEGDLDAFYFFFYSYNLGPNVLGERFGNHVGDWEHAMVRFLAGVPQALYVSTHDVGEAYLWDAVQKASSGQPVVYSAFGDHSSYATPGNQNYADVPFVTDLCNAGVPWNTTLNYQAFWYSDSPTTFIPATDTTIPAAAMYTVAKWGDQAYADSDPRQSVVLGFQRFSDGPPGPIDHTLVRTGMGFDSNETLMNSLCGVLFPVRSSSRDTLCSPSIVNGSADSATSAQRAPAALRSPSHILIPTLLALAAFASFV